MVVVFFFFKNHGSYLEGWTLFINFLFGKSKGKSGDLEEVVTGKIKIVYKSSTNAKNGLTQDELTR